jgi:plastocyanin
MRFRFLIAALAACVIVATAAALAGCSKDKTTNPPVTTTPESFDSNTLALGVPFMHPFSSSIVTKTTFGYRCKFHGAAPFNMTGSVVVDPASLNTSASVTVADYSFTPATVTVKPGSTVTWTENTGTSHTVTRP